MNGISELALKEVKVSSFTFRLNDNYSVQKNELVEISMFPKLIPDREDTRKGQLQLGVQLFNEKFIEENKPFYLKMFVVADFEDHGDTSKDIFAKYAINMLSMIYPYVRSYISATTSMFGCPGVLIPPINVVTLVERLQAEQK